MAYKLCPICSTPAHRTATQCSTCGASLAKVETIDGGQGDTNPRRPVNYDNRLGEADLSENQLTWRGGTYILAAIAGLLLLLCGGITLAVGVMVVQTLTGGSAAPSPVAIADEVISQTATPTRAPLVLATVTPAPPTAIPTATDTPEPTPGPCMQQVQAGDTLIGIVARCGHRSYDVLNIVLEINDLDAPERIQIGQMLEIPWPTPTPDPDAAPVEEAPADGAGETSEDSFAVVDIASIQIRDPFFVPTATLQPGVMWHTVRPNENIIVIAFNYGANLRILSELNPEVTFSQCDFSLASGGPNCVVALREGQQVRVPEPTPLPTLSPTPSGSETPTPTATATFNAPSAVSPGNRALFRRDELVTLRWVASGTLGSGQVYRVNVEDLTAGMQYRADTTDLSFILPRDWQGRDTRRHDYAWTVSVIDQNRPDNPYFTTETRLFTWEAQEGG